MRSFQTSDCNQVKMQFLLFVRMETQNYKCIYSSFKKKKENKKEKTQLTVGLEPTTSGLEVQCAIQLRHASSCHTWTAVLYEHHSKSSFVRIVIGV